MVIHLNTNHGVCHHPLPWPLPSEHAPLKREPQLCWTIYVVHCKIPVYKRKLNISMCVVWVFYHVLVEHFWYKHKVLDEKHKCEKHWICSNAVLECHDCCADSAQTHVNLLLSKYFVFYDSSSESADKCLWSNTATRKQPCLENILICEHPFVSICFLWHLCLYKYR